MTEVFYFVAIRILVEAGADINKQGEIGVTAIYVAVDFNRLEVVRFLAEVTYKHDLNEIGGWRAFIGGWKLLQNGLYCM